MTMMGKLIVGLLGVVLIAGCGSDVKPVESEYDFADYRAFVGKIGGAERVEIFEGLPSDFSETELYKAELAKGVHAEIDGYATLG